MMKLAILGNSHTAALLHAPRADASLISGLEITFFASIGRTMENFALEAGQLVPQTDDLRQSLITTSRGSDRIDPSLFDQVLIVGLGFNMPAIDTRLSQAVRDAVLRNGVEGSVAWKLASMIRNVSDVPILASHTPLRAADVSQRFEATLKNCMSYDAMIARSQMFWDAVQVQVLTQPPITRYRDILTQRSFSRGSRGLRGVGLEHDDTDRSHMNAEYGAIYLRQLQAELSKRALRS
jgi:hypothetical protein